MYGQYHSIYDSFDWVKKFGGDGQDSFELMANLARVNCVVAFLIANKESSAFCPKCTAEFINDGVEQIANSSKQVLSAMGNDAHPINDVLEFQIAIDQLKNASQQFAASVDTFVKTMMHNSADPDAARRKVLVERQFVSPEGLPKRKWFRSILAAPAARWELSNFLLFCLWRFCLQEGAIRSRICFSPAGLGSKNWGPGNGFEAAPARARAAAAATASLPQQQLSLIIPNPPLFRLAAPQARVY